MKHTETCRKLVTVLLHFVSSHFIHCKFSFCLKHYFKQEYCSVILTHRLLYTKMLKLLWMLTCEAEWEHEG